MIGRLIWNDIRRNKLLSVVTVIFMSVSAMLLALTVLLSSSLLGAIDSLMERAKTPDFLQMHAGDLEEGEIRQFAEEHPEVISWQICEFLNLENGTITLGDKSLSDSTQDNGLCVQGEEFDYLLDMENNLPEVAPGEVYVPACYRSGYDLNIGDTMKIRDIGSVGDAGSTGGEEKGSYELRIAGFLRDSQMNSMMSSSKRFLINETEYEKFRAQGDPEYLIEFLLKEGTDTGAFGTDYAGKGLPANGPVITKPLIRMMNALSDGMMILVLFLVSLVVLLISMLCIRFVLALRMEKDRRETGMLRALGIGKREIRQLYFIKYILMSAGGALLGLLAAGLLKKPLVRQMQELYGASDGGWQTGAVSLLAVLLTEGIILRSIHHGLKKAEKCSILEAMFPVQKEESRYRRGQYLFIGFVAAACTFFMVVPQNLYSTLSDPGFVTYMGIGDGELRMDVRQTEKIEEITAQLDAELAGDPRVREYTVLRTRSCPAFLSDGRKINLTVEEGDHTIFPVSYAEGKTPEKETELALSTLNAKELGLSVGDVLQLQAGGETAGYTICGIYSDITNGGKTAKSGRTAQGANEDAPVMWSVFYLSLDEAVSREQWMAEYSRTGIRVVDIADYVEETYGQTLRQLRLASGVASVIAVILIFVVVTLFMRLIVERNRYSISLQKALGFSSGSVEKLYLGKGLLPAAEGIVTGLLIGNTCGEWICGMVLNSLGADGFQFVIAWGRVLLLIPAISLAAAGAAVRAGISEIRRIRPFECCMGKE